jgi:glucose/arabinose dehydrogenase
LRSTLQQAEHRADLLGYRYDALAQLGNWGVSQQNYFVARTAWADAAHVAEQSGAEGAEARGRAKALEGIAIAAPWLDDPHAWTQTGLDALSAFAVARPLLYPAAIVDAPNGALTPQQQIYARALAWDGAVRSRLRERDVTVPASVAPGESAYGYLPATSPPDCTIHLTRPAPLYPRTAEHQGQVGNVVARVRFDERGQMRTADVAATVGGQPFQDAAAFGLRNWTAYFDTATPANCRVPQIYYARINFSFN